VIGLLRWLGLGPRGERDSRGRPEVFMCYVQCNYCREIVRVRIDPRWDATQEFDDGISGYTVRKEILGSACNRVMTLHKSLDRHYGMMEQHIDGGRFATQQEYDAYRARPEGTSRHRPAAGRGAALVLPAEGKERDAPGPGETRP
jgi:hypothetical protein